MDYSSDFLEDRIVDKLGKVDNKPKAVILNGKHYVWNQKSVYAVLTDKSRVEFYVCERKDNASIEKHFITTEIFNNLNTQLSSNKLGNFIYNGTIPENKINIYVDGSLDYLILEGVLYALAKRLIENNQARVGVHLENFQLDVGQVNALLTAFRNISYENYNKFMFSKMQRKIINRCFSKNQFFKIMRAFIPVLIKYKYVYNPLIDDPENTFFMDSLLMKTAIDNKRLITINDNLYCYMLTHEEICRSLGLKHFMRFTPGFLYKYVVGLIHPELRGFPNKVRKVWVRPSDVEAFPGYNASYYEGEYDEIHNNLVQKVLESADDENKTQLSKELLALENYLDITTLYYEIEREKTQLINIGATILDDKVSTDLLYDILMEGSLLIGGEYSGHSS